MNRPLTTVVLAFFIMTSACEQKHDDQNDANDHVEGSENQALYDQVMKIHDEVMPKMNDLYKAKTSLQTRLKLPGLPESERDAVKQSITSIDSASEGMMVWMRQFEPIPDSEGEEKARVYLEGELVKVKKVRENILKALQTAGSAD